MPLAFLEVVSDSSPVVVDVVVAAVAAVPLPECFSLLLLLFRSRTMGVESSWERDEDMERDAPGGGGGGRASDNDRPKSSFREGPSSLLRNRSYVSASYLSDRG